MSGSWLRSEAEQTDEVASVANLGASTSSVTATPCHLPLIGEGIGNAHAPLAPLSGELAAVRLTERLLQICREKPKPQIQFAVWKGRNEHRG